MQTKPLKISPTMNWSEKEILDFGSRVNKILSSYLSSIHTRPISPPVQPVDVAKVFSSPLPEESTSKEDLLEEFEKEIIPNSFHLGNPGYYGLFNPTPTTIGIFAETLSAMLNQNVAAWNHGPAATEIEVQVIRWMCDAMGYGPEAFGTLTNGGSLANYTAVKIALNKKFPEVLEVGLPGLKETPILYASDQCHYSIDKVSDLIGIGRRNLQKISTDKLFRIDAHKLRKQIRTDKERGLAPFCVVGMAGTTNSGAVDDLNELANICEEYGLWLHVDAAWGGTVRFSDKYRALLDGIERSDSVTIDPHKWMYVPFCAGAILVRNRDDLLRCFDIRPAYVSDKAFVEGQPTNFFQYGVAGSRRFDALKIWWSLRHYGRKLYERVINERISLAEYLEQKLSELPDFEIVSPATLAMCCFRFFPRDLQEEWRRANETRRHEINQSLNKLNSAIQVRVVESGRAWVSTTVLNGVRAIRFCVTSYLTTEKDIDELVLLLQEKAREVYPG
jgi:glutamate/tyrosine decarboxylase-like PLP-dependent enzyme